ncbi:MAG TPA: hypothetical protein PLD27_11290 [bacterium]|nr:hypothetical protein [bacterium]HOL48699.1 hypothetical protein [bacterium]HPQ19814.1 hypothetical protein [bacterium]
MIEKIEILLNNKKIDIQLDGIKSFKVFMEELRKYLLNNNMLIDELKLNDKKIDLKNIPDYDLENIKKIEVKAEDINITVINTLGDMIEYINKFLGVVEDLCSHIDLNNLNNYTPTFQKLINGLEWIFTGLRNCEKPIGINYYEAKLNDKTLISVIEEAEYTLSSFKASVIAGNEKNIKEHLFHNLSRVLKTSTEIIRFLFNEFKKMHFSSKELKEQIEYFQEQFIKKNSLYQQISEKIQTGLANEGIELFKKEIIFFEEWVLFLKKLEKTFHNITIHMKINDKTIYQYNTEFMEKLKELSEAFANEDIILISDIIEYEMIEFVNIYLQFLKKLKSEIFPDKEINDDNQSLN